MSESHPIIHAAPAPRLTRLLQFGLICLALAQAGAAIRAATLPPHIAALVSVPPALDIFMGIGWAVLFALLVRGVGRSRAGRRRAALCLGGYAAYALLRLNLFAQAGYDRGRLPFLLMMVVFILLIVFAAVYGERNDA